jgi:Tfp pilus assembly PilM family ATPase
MSPSTALRTGAGRGPSPWAPTPPSIAVEIARQRVTVAELGKSADGPIVSAFATETLPAEAVTPALTGVNVPNPRVVADAIRRACQKAGLGSPRRVALVVPDGIARVSLLHFDQVPPRAADLDQLIRWQLKKSTPFPLEDATTDHVPANALDGGATFVAMVARKDVIAQYEAATAAAGMHAGIVDLASFNVMNAITGPSTGSGQAAAGDSLVICLAHEGTTIAVLRGEDLLFYRHRAAIDEEPLSALVHQTAIYHEDRLGGKAFAQVWVCGAALVGAKGRDATREVSERLGIQARTVDVRLATNLRDRTVAPDVLDALAAPAGVLIRERV